VRLFFIDPSFGIFSDLKLIVLSRIEIEILSYWRQLQSLIAAIRQSGF